MAISLADLRKIVLLIAEMKTHPDPGGLFPPVWLRFWEMGGSIAGFIFVGNPGVLRAFPEGVSGNRGLE